MKLYYIGENMAEFNPNALSDGVKIMCIKSEKLILKTSDTWVRYDFSSLDGPYRSIQELKKKSTIFKELVKSDAKRSQQIQQSKNIIQVKDLIIRNRTKGVPLDYIKLFEHTTAGSIKSKKIFGVHYFDNERMSIIKHLGHNDDNNVWKAIIKVTDLDTGISNEKESTFFPIEWSVTQLFNECEYAYKNMRKKEATSYINESQTLSGVPVEIIKRGNTVKSIYPIYNGNIL